ncbi:Hypothetical predicted protein [Cloeon dipterum]|uniref:Chromodomain-helicase-DNA-binding protein 1-like C-terminal domain-containing protein n=1 Tax=Cloeon dipterum TaxID=197152 RepID=A0A8S1CE62_9INSE|nr:Hypothetical predicted protein [Cloeon dipterum]
MTSAIEHNPDLRQMFQKLKNYASIQNSLPGQLSSDQMQQSLLDMGRCIEGFLKFPAAVNFEGGKSTLERALWNFASQSSTALSTLSKNFDLKELYSRMKTHDLEEKNRKSIAEINGSQKEERFMVADEFAKPVNKLSAETSNICSNLMGPRVKEILQALDELGLYRYHKGKSIMDVQVHNQMKLYLYKIGAQIEQCLERPEVSNNKNQWRRHLWSYVKNSTYLSQHFDLEMLYYRFQLTDMEDKQIGASHIITVD